MPGDAPMRDSIPEKFLEYAALCRRFATTIPDQKWRAHFMALAEGWESDARRVRRDREAIEASRAILAKLDAERGGGEGALIGGRK